MCTKRTTSFLLIILAASIASMDIIGQKYWSDIQVNLNPQSPPIISTERIETTAKKGTEAWLHDYQSCEDYVYFLESWSGNEVIEARYINQFVYKAASPNNCWSNSQIDCSEGPSNPENDIVINECDFNGINEAVGCSLIDNQCVIQYASNPLGFALLDPETNYLEESCWLSPQLECNYVSTIEDVNQLLLDVYFFAKKSQDYYEHIHTYNSVDPSDHFKVQLKNLSGATKGLYSGPDAVTGGIQIDPAGANIAVVGHEFTHYFMDVACNATYIASYGENTQAYPFRESFADIMAMFLVRYLLDSPEISTPDVLDCIHFESVNPSSLGSRNSEKLFQILATGGVGGGCNSVLAHDLKHLPHHWFFRFLNGDEMEQFTSEDAHMIIEGTPTVKKKLLFLESAIGWNNLDLESEDAFLLDKILVQALRNFDSGASEQIDFEGTIFENQATFSDYKQAMFSSLENLNVPYDDNLKITKLINDTWCAFDVGEKSECCFNVDSDLVIDGSELWVDRDIVVKSGAKLTINNSLNFFKDTEIVVQSGAELVLSNQAKLKNHESNSKWKGITVLGSGTLRVNGNVEIKNAEIAINLPISATLPCSDDQIWNNPGATIDMSGTTKLTLSGNNTDIEIARSSADNDETFVLRNIESTHDSSPAFVFSNAGNIEVRNSTFTSNDQTGTGIYFQDCIAKVESSFFHHLDRGIILDDIYSTCLFCGEYDGPQILNNYFGFDNLGTTSPVKKGIYLESQNRAVVKGNIFRDIPVGDDNYAIHFVDGAFYAIEANEIQGISRNGMKVQDGSAFGVTSVLADADGDRVPDYVEEEENTDPNDTSSFLDSDGDGVPDYVEITESTDPADLLSFTDFDYDGLPDYTPMFTQVIYYSGDVFDNDFQGTQIGLEIFGNNNGIQVQCNEFAINDNTHSIVAFKSGSTLIGTCDDPITQDNESDPALNFWRDSCIDGVTDYDGAEYSTFGDLVSGDESYPDCHASIIIGCDIDANQSEFCSEGGQGVMGVPCDIGTIRELIIEYEDPQVINDLILRLVACERNEIVRLIEDGNSYGLVVLLKDSPSFASQMLLLEFYSSQKNFDLAFEQLNFMKEQFAFQMLTRFFELQEWKLNKLAEDLSLTILNNEDSGLLSEIASSDQLGFIEARSILARSRDEFYVHPINYGGVRGKKADSRTLLNSELVVFPNPANSGQVFIETDQNILELTILTVSGERLLNKNGGNKTIQIEAINPGIYIIEVVFSDYSISYQKLIIR